MSIGPSGRIVLEVEPDLKRQLYATLIGEGLTLKDWFVKSASTYVGTGKAGSEPESRTLKARPTKMESKQK